MTSHRGLVPFALFVILTVALAAPARAGWPAADQMPDVRALAEQLVGQANQLATKIREAWPGDREFIKRADRFANRAQHLLNITSEAIRKQENGRHTQSAHGDVRNAWNALNALPAASGIGKWKERKKINGLLDQLGVFYQ